MRTTIIVASTVALVLGALSMPSRAEETAAKDEAIMCPKCEAVWVKEKRNLGKTTVYVSKKKMTCDDCKSAVENFFATGKLEHSCKTCGDLVKCESVQGEKPADADADAHRKD